LRFLSDPEMSEERPDPERLLARLQREEGGKERGRLKVFFGAVAGVGKTYAMLEEARLRRGQGADVVVGWVETHGRSETAALLEDLEILPPRAYAHRETTLREFDLDAALARRPQLLVLDELAHTNAPGARHAKRWHDAEELLAAGIDVYTTLNVQHIESLNDVVAQTTGITVRETVPDSVLDRADDIELVDLTPEDLLERLKEGKVYIPAQAERAMRGFFKKGNLIALRELALRRVAERVDSQLRTYKDDEGIGGVWPVAERILVSVSANPEAMRVVRAAARMAAVLRAEWIVAYVEKPGDLTESDADRARVEGTFRLAEQLGAETVTLTGLNVSDELLALARKRNVTKIVVGKPARPWWRYRFFGSVVDELIRGSDEIDVYVIRGNPDEDRPAPFPRLRRRSPPRSYLWAAVAVALTTALCRFLLFHLAPTNLVMVYLLEVVIVASVLGRGPSILASILSVAAFDFFFVPPHLNMAVSDTEYLVTFVVMLVVGLSISSLAVRLRQQADAHRRRQERTASLYRMSREFAQTTSIEEVAKSVERYISEVFESEVWLLITDSDGRLVAAPGVTSAFPLDPKELAVAEWAGVHGQRAGRGTATLMGAKALYFPLATARGVVGVLGLFSTEGKRTLSPEQIELFEAVAGQVALVIERSMLAEEAQAARLRVEAERLQNLLLSSVSHDLRTPMAAITGAASSLLEGEGSLDGETRRELTASILEDADRLNRLVGNLLSMTRIESGGMKVQREWQPLEEVVGAALNHLEKRLRGHAIDVRVPDVLPLVPLDGVLIEQVLVNLLENAIKYTPDETTIEIGARAERNGVVVEVGDRGPGIPAGDEERVFEKFYRAPHAPDRAGVGLGLPICRGIIEAHGGKIWAENRPGGGAVFRFHLPCEGTPPTLDQTGAAS
jgi:two-component system, OmpR family, sensor histidine kinase KdpD